MRENKKPPRWKNFFLIILLALICVGGVELLVCRIVDPALYERITAPVRTQVELLVTGVQDWEDSLWQKAPEEEETVVQPEDQFAGDPAIWAELPQQDPAITKLEARPGEGKEILTGGTMEIVYFNQTDPSWKDKPYGSDGIGGYGCGPTAMAMAVSSLTAETVTPDAMALWARENGHWARGRGSYLSLVEGAAQAYGLDATPCRAFEADRLRRELASGKLIVALVTKGHFTQGGHFILLRGATLEGGILVADPSSRERSLVVWEAQLILDELSSSRNDGAPLWILTPEGFRPEEE